MPIKDCIHHHSTPLFYEIPMVGGGGQFYDIPVSLYLINPSRSGSCSTGVLSSYMSQNRSPSKIFFVAELPDGNSTNVARQNFSD